MTLVNSDIESLADPFKAKVRQLLETLERNGLPFRLFEARRSFSRSSELFMRGREYGKEGVAVVVDPRSFKREGWRKSPQLGTCC